MPSNQAKDQTRISEQERAWRLRQKGWAQQRIADELAVNQTTVSRWLDQIERRELKRLEIRVENQKVRQTEWLEHIFDEALQAWERSKKPQQRASTKTVGPIKATASEARERDGDPVFLGTAMAAARDLRRLWGLEAPSRKKEEAMLARGEPFADVVQRMRERAAGHDGDGTSKTN